MNWSKAIMVKFRVRYALVVFMAIFGTPVIAQAETPPPGCPVENVEQVTALLRVERGTTYEAIYSPDGNMIVVAGSEGIWLYDVNNLDAEPRLIADVHEVRFRYERLIVHEVRRVAFSPDGTRIVSASNDGSARVWDVTSGEQIAIADGHTEQAYTAAFSPDGTQVVSGSDVGAQVWNAATGAPVAVLTTHRGHLVRATIGTARVSSAAFNPDGTHIALASGQTVRVWNPVNGEQIALLEGHSASVRRVAFSPDGMYIVSASDDSTVRVWDAISGQQTAILAGHAAWVNSAAFSPDGSQIVSASGDLTVRIWSATIGEQVAVLTGHTGTVHSAAFSPDGKSIISASDDGTVRLWSIRCPA
jgi:WD40 repeat protein